jgi:hypothetical protein
MRKVFTTRRPSSTTRRRIVRLAPIANDSRLQPPVGVWAVLSPSVGDQPLSPPRRLSLGRPLPHQQADITQDPPIPLGPEGSPTLIPSRCLEKTSSRISHRFQWLFQSKGQVPYALLTLPPLK